MALAGSCARSLSAPYHMLATTRTTAMHRRISLFLFITLTQHRQSVSTMSDPNNENVSDNGLLDISETVDLRNLSYSRADTIAAFEDYYKFLKLMYLDEDIVTFPPEGGWPEITTESMQNLGKTDEVVALLRHIPYIQVSANRKKTHSM